jgi:hypothetical protein
MLTSSFFLLFNTVKQLLFLFCGAKVRLFFVSTITFTHLFLDFLCFLLFPELQKLVLSVVSTRIRGHFTPENKKLALAYLGGVKKGYRQQDSATWTATHGGNIVLFADIPLYIVYFSLYLQHECI